MNNLHYILFSVLAYGIAFGLFFMWWKGRLTVHSVGELAAIMDSRGGNILILLALVLIFYKSALHLFYWALDKVISGTLKPDNTIALMGLSFVTGAAFGGAFPTLLKAMTGLNGVKDKPDVQNPDNKQV